MKKLLLSSFVLLSAAVVAQSWVDQATGFPTSFGVDEISIVDANTVWITAYDGTGAGTYPKIVGKTTNGGTTWTAYTVSGPGTNALLSDIHGIDANTAFIVTAPHTAGANANRMWKTTNGGTTWTQQTIGYTANSFANHVYFWDANSGWTSGDPLNGKFEMFKTTNGGTTWTAVAGAPVPVDAQEYTYVGMKEVVGNSIWVGTSFGRLLHSTDKGETWNGYYTPVLDFGGAITSGSTGKLTMRNATSGLLIAVDGLEAGGNVSAGLYSTEDSGATWELVEPTGVWYYGDITYVPGTPNTYVSTGIAAAVNDPLLGSSYSKDGGLTWTSIDSGLQRGEVKFLNATTGWAGQFSDGPGGRSGILKFDGNLNLGVADTAAKASLRVFPNPTSDVLSISSDKKIESVTIFDLSGKKVQSLKGTNQINVSSLAKGNYMLQVSYSGGAVENTKFIKK